MNFRLSVNALHAGYTDGMDIVKNVTLHVRDKQVVTIAGTNGAGKSSLIRAIMGLLPQVRGEVLVNGHNVVHELTERRLLRGLGYVPQVHNVFATLSVLENLQVMAQVENVMARVEQILILFPALKDKLRIPAAYLSGGERQQLAFARALMHSPAVLLLDEPSAALSPAMVEQVFMRVRLLSEQGISILMVEQRARQALSFSDYGYILDAGEIVLQGEATDILDNTEMARLYLGQDKD